MDTQILVLYYSSSIAGLIMVIGGIWLIYKEKIYIDRESNKVTEIDTPIGKFKTNFPALVLFFIGFLFLAYPLGSTKHLLRVKRVKICGSVHGNAFPVLVYAVIESDPLQQARDFILHLPVFDQTAGDYKIIYVAGNVLMEDIVDLNQAKGGIIRLTTKDMNISVKKYEPNVPLREVPSEFR